MKFELNKLYLLDCVEAMREIPDNYFKLAIVDPPYGIGVDKMTLGNAKRVVNRGINSWDNKPPLPDFFDLLKIKSKNQIIFGANHFIDNFPFMCNSSCWIFWDKGTGSNDFADGELAWTSFSTVVKKYKHSWVGANAKEKNELDRIHPTQKPVALYKWLLKNYAKPNDKILDTHAGSCSSVIACIDGGFDWMAFEIDPDYYKAAIERINNHVKQGDIFNEDKSKHIQITLL